jgi:hypothetical protein
MSAVSLEFEIPDSLANFRITSAVRHEIHLCTGAEMEEIYPTAHELKPFYCLD